MHLIEEEYPAREVTEKRAPSLQCHMPHLTQRCAIWRGEAYCRGAGFLDAFTGYSELGVCRYCEQRSLPYVSLTPHFHNRSKISSSMSPFSKLFATFCAAFTNLKRGDASILQIPRMNITCIPFGGQYSLREGSVSASHTAQESFTFT